MKPKLTIDQVTGATRVEVEPAGLLISSRLGAIIIEEDSLHGYIVFPEGMKILEVPDHLRNVLLRYEKV